MMPTEDNAPDRIPLASLIHQFDAEGKSPTEIGELLELTPQSIRNVLAGLDSTLLHIDPRVQLLDEIRQTDSIDQGWPPLHLIDVFNFPTTVRRILTFQFEVDTSTPLSLRTLLEYFIGAPEPNRPNMVISRYFDFPAGGVKGYWGAVGCITSADLGETANTLWRKKLKCVENADRIKAPGPHKRSKPLRGKP